VDSTEFVEPVCIVVDEFAALFVEVEVIFEVELLEPEVAVSDVAALTRADQDLMQYANHESSDADTLPFRSTPVAFPEPEGQDKDLYREVLSHSD
jgi:hypothetical protein